MSKYIIRWYPVKPYDELFIYNLDCLQPEYSDGLAGTSYHEEAKMYDTVYNYMVQLNRGVPMRDAFGHVIPEILGYNNAWWFCVEADQEIEALLKFANLIYGKRKLTKREIEKRMAVLNKKRRTVLNEKMLRKNAESEEIQD